LKQAAVLLQLLEQVLLLLLQPHEPVVTMGVLVGGR
jgi:hypothetical protein